MNVICDRGAELLIQGIIGQAVDDYIKAMHNLDELYDSNVAIIKIIKEASKSKRAKIKTLGDAYKELDLERARQKARVAEVKRFFDSEQYKSYTDVSGAYMLQLAHEKYLEQKEERKNNKV